MRASSHIQLKERKQLTLENFKGVDFSSSPLRVHSNRASNMQNFINEYGVNRKRNGWNELFRIEDENGNAQPINGIFQFIKGNRKDLLVHAGKRIYKITKEKGQYSYEDITLSSTYSPAKVDPSVLTNTRSQAFVNQGKCYIIGCGDYLVWGSWNEGETYELRRVVNNEDTYIPTTTISIDDDSVSDDTRGNLDDVNLLSSLRKNQLLGRAFKEGETSLTWTLDSGKVDEGSDLLIVLETMEGGSSVTYTIENNSSDKTKLFKTKRDDEGVVAEECGSVNYATGQITFNEQVARMDRRIDLTNQDVSSIRNEIDIAGVYGFGAFYAQEAEGARNFIGGGSIDRALKKRPTGLQVSLDDNYILSVKLTNPKGETLVEDSVDFPVESLVMNGSYDNGVLTLTLKNGNKIPIDITSLISGLVANSRKINGKPLSSDITLSASDIGAYEKGETDSKVAKVKTDLQAEIEEAKAVGYALESEKTRGVIKGSSLDKRLAKIEKSLNI